RATNFIEDIGADSLDIVELIMELEEEFDIQIPDDQAEKIKTVGEAIDYIEREIGKKLPAASWSPVWAPSTRSPRMSPTIGGGFWLATVALRRSPSLTRPHIRSISAARSKTGSQRPCCRHDRPSTSIDLLNSPWWRPSRPSPTADSPLIAKTHS